MNLLKDYRTIGLASRTIVSEEEGKTLLAVQVVGCIEFSQSGQDNVF